MLRRCVFVSLFVCVGCGVSVTPQSDGALADAALDRDDAATHDSTADQQIADTQDASQTDSHNDVPDDDATADAANDEAMRPPFSRVVFLDTSLLRDTAELERVEAARIAPHDGGSWSRTQSGPCVVESRVQRTYTRFADSLEVQQLSPEQAPFFAQAAMDERLVWKTYSNIFSEGDRLRITARRADWPTPWSIELTTPVVALVTVPTWRVFDVSYREPLQFRWRSAGVSPEALVRITFLRTTSAAEPRVFNEWLLECDVEPWREQATITLSDHPLFPLRPGVDRALVILVDTVLTQHATLPNGERVIIENRSNARSVAPNLTP